MRPALTFVPGRPAAPCRPYTADELAAMRAATLAGVRPAAPHEPPHAVLVSGLPGSGKSCVAARLAAAHLLLPRPPPSLAWVDPDTLRGFHAQFASLHAACLAGGECFEDLVPWWLEGARFEEAVFRAPDSLMDALLASRCSFVLCAVMRSEGSVAWARHVAARGYTAHLLLVHTPAEVAAARAAARARATGRCVSAAHVRDCEEGLREHSGALAAVCAASGGTVRLLDNSAAAGAAGPRAAALLAAPLDARVADAYAVRAPLLSPERVRAFAATQLARLPHGALAGVDCCLAGGAFKCLLQPRASPADDPASQPPPPRPPRDLDIWPVTERDEALLVERLSRCALHVVTGPWNTRLTLPAPPSDDAAAGGAPLVVEVVHAYGRDMAATMAHADIALSAVGVAVRRGALAEAAVHPLALESARRMRLLLLPGAAARPRSNALSTAERLLRYARELRWQRPHDELAELRAAFWQAPPERRAEQLRAFRGTRLHAEDATEAYRIFGLEDEAGADGRARGA
jgi:hypothetical protein